MVSALILEIKPLQVKLITVTPGSIKTKASFPAGISHYQE